MFFTPALIFVILRLSINIASASLCQQNITCPCGSTNQNYTFCLNNISTTEDICKRWKRCEECRANYEFCVKCAPGLDGPTCMESFLSTVENNGTYHRIKRSDSFDEEPLFCRNPGEITNGQIVQTDIIDPRSSGRRYPAGSEVRFVCNDGYSIVGGSRIFCLYTGEWSATTPTCDPLPGVSSLGEPVFCRNPRQITNGRIVQTSILDPRSSKSRFQAGSEIRIECNDGYRIEGESKIFCLNTGEWSDAIPTCNVIPRNSEPKLCPNLGQISNGQIIQTSTNDPKRLERGYIVGSEVRFTCNDGYDMVGQSYIYCLNSGEWSGAIPRCEATLSNPIDSVEKNIEIYCEDPGPIGNGRFRVSFTMDTSQRPRRPSKQQDQYREGTRLQYYCEGPFWLMGSETVICESSGYWSADPPSCIEECGQSLIMSTHPITNGISTVAGQWPWVVAIAVRNGNFSDLKCGGVLLDSRTVLTAAHCLVDFPVYTLYFGKFHLRTRWDDAKVLNRLSSRLILHPGYNATSYENDIALIKFSRRIRYNERIQPICLPTPSTSKVNLQPNTYGYVAGWGLTEMGMPSDTLMMANIPVQPNNQCSRAYEDKGLRDRIKQGMFCAGLEQGVTSACTGDSGSGLVFLDDEYDRFIVEGVVSFSIAGMCGEPRLYTVFTKVYDYLTWILRNMR